MSLTVFTKGECAVVAVAACTDCTWEPAMCDEGLCMRTLVEFMFVHLQAQAPAQRRRKACMQEVERLRLKM